MTSGSPDHQEASSNEPPLTLSATGGASRRFRITFSKRICGDTGQIVHAPQGSFLVDAADGGAAVQIAIRHFCRLRRIANWRLNADRLEVDDLSAVGTVPRAGLGLGSGSTT